MRRYLSLLALAALCVAGCESEDDSDSLISISPQSCRLNINQSRVFTAIGGKNYRWEVKDPSLGIVSSDTGSSVTYIAGDTAGSQVLTVTGTDVAGEVKYSASALIQQIDPSADKADDSSKSKAKKTALTIGGDTTVKAGTSVSLTIKHVGD